MRRKKTRYATSISFLIISGMYVVQGNHLAGAAFIFLAILFGFLGALHYKKDDELKDIATFKRSRRKMDTHLRGLVEKGEEYEAIRICRMVTGFNLKEAKEYVDDLSL